MSSSSNVTSSYIKTMCPVQCHGDAEKHVLCKATQLFGHMLSIVLYNVLKKKKSECPGVQFIGNFMFCILELDCPLSFTEANCTALHKPKSLCP